MKNSWKKTLSLLLCLVLLAGLFPAALAEGETCTLSFVLNGGDYLDPITAEKDSEITLPKAVWNDHFFLGWSLEYNGEVNYQAGDTLVLTENTILYALWRDSQPLGLYAYWADSGDTYTETTVPMNGSITLRVEAGVDTGELSYDWYCYGMDASLLPGESSNVFAIDLVDKHYTVQCTVRDEEGNAIWLYYSISPDTGLWACAAGSGTDYENVSVPIGGSVTLTVEAGVTIGELHCRWYRYLNGSSETLAQDVWTITVDDIEQSTRIYCSVTDDYGNSKTLTFQIRPDTGFWAHAAGTTDTYADFKVKKGESVTLTVEAGVNTGDLHYEWYSNDLDPSLLPTDDSTASVTIPSVEKHSYVSCKVSDDYGNTKVNND